MWNKLYVQTSEFRPDSMLEGQISIHSFSLKSGWINSDRSKMKLFQSAQRCFAMLGIYPIQANGKYLCFNRKIWIVFISYLVGIIFNCVFLFRKVHSFEEYTDIIFRISISILIIICYVVIVLQMENLFQIINNCEEIIRQSKCASFNQQKRKIC